LPGTNCSSERSFPVGFPAPKAVAVGTITPSNKIRLNILAQLATQTSLGETPHSAMQPHNSEISAAQKIKFCLVFDLISLLTQTKVPQFFLQSFS
jgi:hypothetical protein